MQVPEKLKQKKKPRSKILDTIVGCLKNGNYPHVLYWFNKIEQEFILKFVHKSNPEWKADDLELFKKLDMLSKNYDRYLQDKDYETKCKGRCRANLSKLVNKGYLTFIQDIPNGSTILKKYRINVKVKKLINRKQTEESYNNKLSRYKSIDRITDNKGKFKTETQPNEQSHYLCLPKIQQIFICLLPGVAPISNLGMTSSNSPESLMTNAIRCQFNANSDAGGKSVNTNGNIESMNLASTCNQISDYAALQNNMDVRGGFLNNIDVHGGYQLGIFGYGGLQNYMDVQGGLQNNMDVQGGLQNNMDVHGGYQNDGSPMKDAAVPSSPMEDIVNILSPDWYSDNKDIDQFIPLKRSPGLNKDLSSSLSLFDESGCLPTDVEARDFVI